jgi:protein SCO1/2
VDAVREAHSTQFEQSPGPLGRAVRALVGRPLAWVAVIAAIATWPLVWSWKTRLPPAPPVLGAVGEFALVDEAGRPFGSADLRGRVWIASFLETRCAADCEVLARKLARIQGRTRHLEPALHLVSFGVDPEHDTPQRLAAYARAHRASPRMWTFVTGRAEELRAVARAALAPGAGTPERGAAPHGTALVLVDGAGRVRGRYAPDEPGAVDQIVRDAALVVNARPR